MTSASELFYNRRSRSCRNPDPELELDPIPSDRHPRRRRVRHSRREDSDPGRRLHPQVRHPCHRNSHTDRESVQLDSNGATEFGSSSSNFVVAVGSRANGSSLARNDRLPGDVLQARARLLQRLRGISLTGDRDEFSSSDDFGVINPGEWDDWLESVIPSTVLDVRGNQASSRSSLSLKPPGLSLEAVCSLQREKFRDVRAGDATSLECCICLERFCDGDELVRLHCEHKFHNSCLEPWVVTCGDCPYCRASI